ncbi:MAG TPA: hypothetical protein VFY17_07715, partial [Pilimelia sp.]|nr:hypothetical protein [Pilimelia sp.]
MTRPTPARALAAALLLCAGLLAAPAPAAATADLVEREVYADDGTISRQRVPRQVDAPVDEATRRAADAATVTAVWESGPPEQRLDIVFVGDGYTA